MANDLMSYRAAIGNFYNRTQGYYMSYTFHSISLHTLVIQFFHICKQIKQLFIRLLITGVLLLTGIQTCLVFMTLLHVLSLHSVHQTTVHSKGDVLTNSHLGHLDLLNIDYVVYSFYKLFSPVI